MYVIWPCLRGTVDFRCTGYLSRIIFTLTYNYTLRCLLYIVHHIAYVCVSLSLCVLWQPDVVTHSSAYIVSPRIVMFVDFFLCVDKIIKSVCAQDLELVFTPKL